MSQIEYIQILGERNSGTNYLQNLANSNFQGIEAGEKFAWKHGRIHHKHLQAKPIGQVLFLVIFKDPYSWFVSMNEKPHHAPHLYNLPFSDFIRHEWSCYRGKDYDNRKVSQPPQTEEEEMMWERDPITNKRFENVVMLRNVKNRSYLKIQTFANYFRVVRYEDLLEDPSGVIQAIAGEFDLPLRPDFKHTDRYLGKNPNETFDKKDYYMQRQYFQQYTQEDLDYINSYLNEEQEKSIGYEIVRVLPEITLKQVL